MSLGNLLQGVNLVDLGLELVRQEQRKQLIDVVLEFLASLNVAEELRPSDLDTLGGEFPIKPTDQYRTSQPSK